MIENYVDKQKKCIEIYGKKDIMNIFKCESNKALRILRTMYQMNEANKIGREYYTDQESLNRFLNDYKGKKIYI